MLRWLFLFAGGSGLRPRTDDRKKKTMDDGRKTETSGRSAVGGGRCLRQQWTAYPPDGTQRIELIDKNNLRLTMAVGALLRASRLALRRGRQSPGCERMAESLTPGHLVKHWVVAGLQPALL